jgi:hypothetical protein
MATRLASFNAQARQTDDSKSARMAKIAYQSWHPGTATLHIRHAATASHAVPRGVCDYPGSSDITALYHSIRQASGGDNSCAEAFYLNE